MKAIGDGRTKECADHVMPHAPYIGTCKCATSGKLRLFSGMSSSGIGLLVSEVLSSIGDGASDVTGVSGLNCPCEDKS